MKPLPTTFRARGFAWKVIQRESDVAIVEQSAPGWTQPVLNVVIVQKHKARRLPNGEMTQDAEGIPSWEQYGTLAWVASDKADAKARFNKLVDDANRARTQYIPPQQPPEGEKAPTTFEAAAAKVFEETAGLMKRLAE